MSARDRYHEEFRTALESEGWTVTDDPFHVGIGSTNVQIDIRAQRLVIAEKETQRVAIEIKTFRHPSLITDLYDAVGQYIYYRFILNERNVGRTLFLAMPQKTYKRLEEEPILRIFKVENIHLVIYDEKTETIIQWTGRTKSRFHNA